MNGERLSAAEANVRVQAIIVSSLVESARGSGWRAADPYLRRHLVAHALAAGELQALTNDPGFLAAAEPATLVAELGTGRGYPDLAKLYLRCAHALAGLSIDDRLATLRLTALQQNVPAPIEPQDAASWWPLWARARPTTYHRVLRGHTGEVRAVAAVSHSRHLSPRHVVAVTGDDDGMLRSWDLRTGQSLRLLRRSGPPVRSVVIDHLGGLPVAVTTTSGPEGAVEVWDLTDGGRQAVVAQSVEGGVWATAVCHVAVDHVGDTLVAVTGGGGGGVDVWDLGEGRCLRSFHDHQGGVSAVAVGHRGQDEPVAVSVGHDGAVRWRDLAQLQSPSPLGGEASNNITPQSAVALGRRGDVPVAVSAGHDGVLRVWDLSAPSPAEPLLTIEGHKDWVRSVELGRIGRRDVVTTLTSDGTVEVWDLGDGQRRTSLARAGAARAGAVSWLGGRALVATGGTDGATRVWELTDDQPWPARPQQVLEGHSGRVHAVAWVEGRQLAGQGVDESTGADESTGFDESTGVVVTAGENGSVRVWDLSTSTAARTPEDSVGGGEHLVVLPAPRGDVVVSCGHSAVLDVRGLRTGEGRRLRGHTRAVEVLAGAMIDGDPYVASGSGPGEGTVRVWNLDPDWTRTRWELSTRVSQVQTVSLRQIGDRLLVAAGVAHQLFVWEPEADEQQPNTFDGHVSWVRSVEIGEIAGRPVVISGGADHFCRIWDLDAGDSLPLKCAVSSVDFVALTTLDSTPAVVTAGSGGTAEVWDAESGRRLRALTGAIDGVTAMALGTDGRRPLAVCGGSNGVVEVWDLAEGTHPFVLRERSAKVSAVQLGGFDGRTIAAVGSTDGWVEVWDLIEAAAPRRCASIYAGEVSALALRERVLVIGTPLGVTTVELR